MARKNSTSMLYPVAPVTPPGMSGPPLGADGTPNYDRDMLGGITTRTPYVPDPPAQDPPLADGLSMRRKFDYC